MRKYFAILVLAACSNTSSPILKAPVKVEYHDFATAMSQKSTDFVEIRTTQGKIGQVQEVIGAKCQVTGHNYRAEFTTPVMLALPLFRGDTGDALVQCQASVGGKTLTDRENIKATNLTAPEGEGITVKAGSGGVGIGAVFSIRDKKKDRFDYPSKVTLHLR